MNRFTLRMLFRSIRSGLGRYLAILAIVALGVGFFAGLKSAQPSMLSAAENYFASSHMQDFQLLSTLGFTEDDVDAFRSLETVSSAEGAYFADAAAGVGGSVEAWHFMSLTQEVSLPQLTAGRMPEKADECLADEKVFRESDIGSTITISEENDGETLDLFAFRTYTITGLARSPRYMSGDRGSTSILSGSLKGFIYLRPEGFVSEAFHEILLWCDLPGSLYSSEYSHAADAAEKPVRDLLSVRGRLRRSSLLHDAEEMLAEAQDEIDSGWNEFREGEQKAEEELAAAREELDAAEKEIYKGWTRVESGRKELEDGMAAIPGAREKIASGREELESNRAQLEESEEEVKLFRAMYEEAVSMLDEEEARLSELLQEADLTRYAALRQYYEAVAEHQAEVIVLQGMIDSAGEDADFSALQTRLEAAQEALAQAQAELAAAESSYVPDDSAVVTAEDVIAGLHERASELEAQLADAEAQLADGRAQLAEAEKQLDEAEAALDKAERDYPSNLAQIEYAENELLQAEKELAEGRTEYEKAAADTESELAEGRGKLLDAERELAENREEVLSRLSLELYCLDRSKNAGYVSFQNDTGIVNAVSYAFPVFFALIAALVCTTTMTRMIHEERTVIGTMKAMGYGSGAVMSKYLLYSGSSALLGCVLGFFLGTRAIPYIVWVAYSVLYSFSGEAYYYDPLLYAICLVVSVPGILSVTWLTCRNELSSRPAELIRPKPPGNGKRVFLEHIRPLWQSLSFLGKVTLRNAFRYRQRFIMMILGIGGCTALLVAGFGLRDSISDLGALQYGEVSLYDISVSLDPDEFSSDNAAAAIWEADVLSCAMTRQEAVTLIHGNKEINTHAVAADAETLPQVIDLHDGSGRALPFPKKDESVITKKLSTRLSLSQGDTAVLRLEDGTELPVTITGVCENYVNHYIYLSRDTLGSPRNNNALLRLPDGADADRLAASFRTVDGISYVSLTSYEREMLEMSISGLDLVIVLIVVSSGALAFITLYNLTNINIIERSREVATVKVLGFTPHETAAYILRENRLLSVLGALLGLVLGKLLHRFVMGLVDVESMTCPVKISLLSYLFSFVITVLFALGTNLVMRRKLDRIDMAESLKSVE